MGSGQEDGMVETSPGFGRTALLPVSSWRVYVSAEPILLTCVGKPHHLMPIRMASVRPPR
jgi:hypothetical protein